MKNRLVTVLIPLFILLFFIMFGNSLLQLATRASTPPSCQAPSPSGASPSTPTVLTPGTQYLLYCNWEVFSPATSMSSSQVSIVYGTQTTVVPLTLVKLGISLWAATAYWTVPSGGGVMYEFTWSGTDNIAQQGTRITYGQTTTEQVYTLTLTIQDQKGNKLQGAEAKFGTEWRTADANGRVTYTHTALASLDVLVWYNYYEASATYQLNRDITDTITVWRTFNIRFTIKYDDGTSADGTLVATPTGNSRQVEETIAIVNGQGEAYLWDGGYSLTFHASPEVSLGSLAVTNDQSVSFTLSTTTGEATETTTEDIPQGEKQIVLPEIPWELLPTTHIYLLTAALVSVCVVAIYMRYIRK